LEWNENRKTRRADCSCCIFWCISVSIAKERFAMIPMVRKQIYIPKHQQTLLKRRAQARGISEAELIRQALERDLASALSRTFQRNPKAWNKLERFALRARFCNRGMGIISLEVFHRVCVLSTPAIGISDVRFITPRSSKTSNTSSNSSSRVSRSASPTWS